MQIAHSYRFCVPLTLCSSLIAPNVEHIWKLYVFDNPWMSFFPRFRQMDSLSSRESAEHLQLTRMRYSSESIALLPPYAGSLQRTVFTGKNSGPAQALHLQLHALTVILESAGIFPDSIIIRARGIVVPFLDGVRRRQACNISVSLKDSFISKNLSSSSKVFLLLCSRLLSYIF